MRASVVGPWVRELLRILGWSAAGAVGVHVTAWVVGLAARSLPVMRSWSDALTSAAASVGWVGLLWIVAVVALLWLLGRFGQSWTGVVVDVVSPADFGRLVAFALRDLLPMQWILGSSSWVGPAPHRGGGRGGGGGPSRFLLPALFLLFVVLPLLAVLAVLLWFFAVHGFGAFVAWLRRPASVHTAFWIGLLASAAILQLPLRRRYLERHSWKRLADPWLKWQGVSALSVGGVRFLPDAAAPDIGKILLSAGLGWLPFVYYAAVGFLVLSLLLSMVGRTMASSEDGTDPRFVFIVAYGAAWLGALAFAALFFTALMAMIHGQLSPSGASAA